MAAQTVFGQPANPATIASDPTAYSMGMQFTLSQSAPLTGIWFFSASGATSLPTSVCIYQITGTNTGSQVAGTLNSSPSWSGAAGSGWVEVTYNGSVTLAAATNYRVVVCSGSVTGNWYSVTGSYWSSGAGGSGITSGIITAPQASAADGSNQDAFITGSTLAYPNTSFNASNYWIDVEVTPAAAAPSAAPARPGRTWLARFKARQTAVAATSPPVTVQAGVAAAAGHAQGSVQPGIAVPGRAIPGQMVPGDPVAAGLSVVLGPGTPPVPAGVAQPGQTWLRRFKARQAPQPVSVAVPTVNAAAAVAASAAAAPSPVAAAGVNAAATSSAGVATQATAAVTVTAGVAAAAAPATAALAGVSPNAAVAAAAGVAVQPVVAVTVNAGVASAAGVANAASVSTSGNTNAAAAVAAVTAVAPAPVVALTTFAGVAAVSSIAPGATVSTFTGTSAPAGVATALAAARPTSLAATANAQPARVLTVGVNVPPPFTVGTLTATTSAAGAGGTLTASDTRTGGPGG